MQVVNGREIPMARLRRVNSVPASVPVQEGFSQAGARGQHGDVPLRLRASLLDPLQVAFRQNRHGVTDRFQVIDQGDPPEAKRAFQFCLLDHPRQVGQGRLSGDHGSGHPEYGPMHPLPLGLPGVQELLDNLLEAFVSPAGVGFFAEGRGGVGSFLVQGEDRLCAADVSG